MIKSMTGFGRSEYNDGKRNITVEIKAVNHRYSDVSVKMPRRYGFAEDKVKAAVKGKPVSYTHLVMKRKTKKRINREKNLDRKARNHRRRRG